MDTRHQVKSEKSVKLGGSGDKNKNGNEAEKSAKEHHKHLQKLSNEEYVPYSKTLRVVTHQGNPAPYRENEETRKHVGYIRNEFGGYFTS